MNKILARCERTNEFEEWNSFIKDDTGMRVNKVLVFFHDDSVKVFILSSKKEDLNDTDYLNEVLQLVHDMPVQFDLEMVLLESNEMCEDNIKMLKDKYLEKK